MSFSDKLLSFEDAPAAMARLRAEGRRIVQCHGTFDLLHPGHIVHFEEAKALGDVLVVTITGDEFVNKGPGRPHFNQHLRVKFLTSIQSVDHVVVIPFPAAVEAIECVRPHVYCKGKEYENAAGDVTGNILDDVKTVERVGGEVRYVGSIVFSSTKLLNRHFEASSPEVKAFCRELSAQCPPEQLRDTVDGFSDLRVLVIGDVIFDRFSTVNVQGLTSKDRILSGRFVGRQTQPGGALAVYRHIKQFVAHPKIVSLVGPEPWVEQALSEHVDPDDDEILRIPEFTTVLKERFVEPLQPGKELAKLFSVNFIDAQPPGPDVHRLVHDLVACHIDDFDLVMAMDFGHGLMAESIRELLQDRARFLALNCQTNSNNHGFNIINRQYRRADSFSLDQTELSLACGRRHFDFREELQKLHAAFGATYAWLTRGAVDTIGLRNDGTECRCEPFEKNVVDPIGAGDAFCAAASLAAARGLPIPLATFMGQLAGAEAVRIVGNAEPVSKSRFLKSGMSMLSF